MTIQLEHEQSEQVRQRHADLIEDVEFLLAGTRRRLTTAEAEGFASRLFDAHGRPFKRVHLITKLRDCGRDDLADRFVVRPVSAQVWMAS